MKTTEVTLIFLIITLSCSFVHSSKRNPEDGDVADKIENEDSSTLRLVQVVFRHGDRSPTHSYTNDTWQESDWPQGFGQLSQTGMLQEYQLGQFFKKRYTDTGFLNATYKRTEVYARSTDMDRTLMSAYSVLAALYPPQGSQKWKDDILWQPIPVHTVPVLTDYLLSTGSPCPVFTEAAAKHIQTSQVVKETVEKNKALYEYMAENAGETPDWPGMGQVLDPLFCQNASGYKLPDWVNKDDTFDRMMSLRDIYASQGIPQNVAYLRGGVLVGELLDHMKNKSSSTPLSQKMFIYSGHDSTLDGLLTTMGVYNNRQPPYTACVIVELRELSAGKFVVDLYYRNETGRDPYPLTLKNCDTHCPLEDFQRLMAPSIPNDIYTACGLPNPGSTSALTRTSETTIAVAVLTSLLLLVLVVGGILCYMRRNKSQDNKDYRPIPLDVSSS